MVRVLLNKRIYFICIRWFLFRQRFSVNGDSGSWVVVPAGVIGPEERLLDMIHAGGIHGSHVILAEPLLAFFKELLNDTGKLVPDLLAAPFEETNDDGWPRLLHRR
jgi:hypothetical protein